MRHPSLRFPLAALPAACVASALALVACGGGSSSPAAGTPSTAASLTLSGTAATGAAIAGRLVEARCNGGTGSATSGDDGHYEMPLAAGALPCVLRVTTSDGTVLHTLAIGSGATAQANLTPVSEMVVARLTGGAPAAYYDAFDAAAAAALTDAQVQAAVSATVAALKNNGIDLGSVGNVLSAALVAAHGTTPGNPFDELLGQLQTALAARDTTLAALVDALAKSSPAAPATSLSADPSLPADTLLSPAAANCKALRSGRYRVVVNDDPNTVPGGTDVATEVVSVDATRLQVTNSNGEVATFTEAGPCRYTGPQGGGITVTPAGVVVAQFDAPPYRGALLFPEQSHDVTELAGEWNSIGLDRTTDNGPVHVTTATLVWDAAGRLGGGQFCDGVVSGCGTFDATNLPDITISANPAGGFDVVNTTDGWRDRLFAYRAGGGELMLVQLAPGGHLGFSTRKVARAMPTVGDVSQGWQIGLVPNATPPYYTAPAAISQFESTVSALDAANQRFERQAVSDFTTNVTRPETVAINAPRDGYTHRLPASVVDSSGATVNVGEWVALQLRGMGLAPVGVASNNNLVLAAAQGQ
ncbi:MAG: hypothetical protein ABT20_00230 [Rubrivivax sp. SCN 70-15]|nr:MAG: hypothetical protein ABT20_00230 [Rubrivivax sp. SCN 70-15]